MNESDGGKLVSFKNRSDRAKARQINSGDHKVYQSQEENSLDAVVTVRLNAKLKEYFDELCRNNHSTISRELKLFMTEAVRTQTLL